MLQGPLLTLIPQQITSAYKKANSSRNPRCFARYRYSFDLVHLMRPICLSYISIFSKDKFFFSPRAEVSIPGSISRFYDAMRYTIYGYSRGEVGVRCGDRITEPHAHEQRADTLFIRNRYAKIM